ncbi:D-alanyl-D-alanine carboxypeptidase family protein [Actinomadura flavalba]|uniref:D-alanyl-D-alanine carboxypeptidase family protein n=1 Tax=Actinomadura flavalba TaxID=1120938 RepID=UPI000374005F|nr:D-alanyl-D-alanine carboxypeptidase family protein [Actinomadura flavalba]
MPTPRAAVLTVAFLVLASLGAPAGSAAQRDDPLDALRRQAVQARDELEKATRTMEKRRKTLAESEEKLRTTLKDLGAAEADLNRIRGPLARLANAAYQQQDAAGSMTVFGRGDPTLALRSGADVGHIARTQQRLVEQADRFQKRRETLASTAQTLQSRNAVDKTRVQQDIDGLKAKSASLTRELTAMLDKMNAGRDRRLELACDKDLAGDARRFPNGLIPQRFLCALPQRGEQLRADAALAFYKLNAAYKRRFGRDMCVTDSYRSLAAQHRVYAQRPGFAAVPGTSNHGKGQAVDLCGGVQNAGSVQFRWVEANARRYGWFHPAWAYSNPFEPWHWEFGEEER